MISFFFFHYIFSSFFNSFSHISFCYFSPFLPFSLPFSSFHYFLLLLFSLFPYLTPPIHHPFPPYLLKSSPLPTFLLYLSFPISCSSLLFHHHLISLPFPAISLSPFHFLSLSFIFCPSSFSFPFTFGARRRGVKGRKERGEGMGI